MLNIEYYKDKLKELGIINLEKLALVQGQPHICDDNIRCRECLFNQFSSLCSVSALNWLFTEYKEEKEEPEEPKLTGRKSRLIHLYWLESMKMKNGTKDILQNSNMVSYGRFVTEEHPGRQEKII